MKEVIVRPGPKAEIIESAVPKPGANQVVIKVVVTGTNPKDWKVPEWMPDKVVNQGDDIAGEVHAVGDNVTEFKVGDRVAAFHQMLSPHGSYAEYALAWESTTFHLPHGTSFEQGATVPLAAMTAALGMYARLGLPEPWSHAAIDLHKTKEPTPLVVYGAASAVGAFAVQLAQRSGIHPVICVAGRGIPFVEGLIDKSRGDAVVDYRGGAKAVVDGIKGALGGKPLRYAFDAVSEKDSYLHLSEVLASTGSIGVSGPSSRITLVLPGMDYSEIPAHVEQTITNVGQVHAEGDSQGWDFGYVWFRYLSRGLKEGWFKPHPHEVVAGGLAGVQTALDNLKEGKASAVKYVMRVGETQGL